MQTSAHSPGLHHMAALQGNWEMESSPVLQRKGSLKATVRATPVWVSLRREVLEDTGDGTEPHVLSTLLSV